MFDFIQNLFAWKNTLGIAELITIPFVFLQILAASASKSIWKFSVSGGTTTGFAPAAEINTEYSGKNGAITINSSSSLVVSDLKQIESDAAAPIVI